jgi:Fe-Mn family superoxide dismutase
MAGTVTYKPREFNLSGLNGISDRTLETHFGLYQGYVKNTNALNEKIAELLGKDPVSAQNMVIYSELSRRLGFEYNGMVLHEYYFGNMKKGGEAAQASGSRFYEAAEGTFGSFERWKADFVSIGQMRGVGWAACYEDPSTGRFSNHWINLHETGNVAGFTPVLIMDVWEHAFLLDYKPAERPKYIDAFFSNIDWSAVEQRMKGQPRPMGAGR